MADIRLQDYVTQIKELIRSVRLDEAIAHCQHILRHYPKHVETYSLLGEACLEKELYREAIEFFQRTLGADPENLIARVGLGVIYDEQGAFPEAIWQLERAFELVPGNSEVRRELLRLYSQYDEIDKTRLKLTRGALGRLYSRNGLYERAIGEFHAVLRQDPELPDIRVALLEALWREGRQLEAVEICMELLDALPNCLKANLLLGHIWLRGGNEEAAQQCLSLARALDPENRVAQELLGPDSPLPPEEVLIPELDAIPDEFEIALSGMPRAGAIGAEEALETLSTEAPDEEEQGPWGADEELPEWLRDVGVTEEAPTLELAPEDAALEPPPDEPLPAEDMPEWLQEVMGEGEKAPAEEPVATEVEELTDEGVVDEEPPESLQEAESPDLAGVGLAAGAAVAAGLVTASMLDDEEQEPAGDEQPDEEMPEWLQELVGEAAPPLDEEPVAEAEEIAELPVAEAEVEVETPVLEGEALQADEAPPDVEAPEEIPDWLDELGAVGAVGVAVLSVAEGEEEAPPDGDAPELATEPIGELDTAGEEEIGALPVTEAEAAVLEEEVLADEESPAVAEEPEEIPDWLRDLGIAEVEEEAQPAEEIPDWLRDLDAAEVEEVTGPPVDEVQTEDAPAVAEVPLTDEIPDWLRDLDKADVEEVAGAPVAEVGPGVAGEDAVPASLLALVAAGLLDEADLESAMDEMSADELEAQRAEGVPEWLSELVEEEPIAAEAAPAAATPFIQEIAIPVTEMPEEEPPVAEPEAEILIEEAVLEAVEEAVPEVVEPEAEVLVEEAVLEAAEPEPEVPVEEAVPEVAEPEAEVLVEEAVLEAVEPEPEVPVEEAVPEVAEPEAEVLVEEAVLEVVELEPEVPVEEAVPEVAEPEAEVLVEEAVLEVAEEKVVAPSRADELLQQLKTRPRDYSSRLELARLYHHDQDWDAALENYEKLISARRFLPDVVDDLESLAQQDVDPVRVYHMLGDAYMQQDQLDDALEMYRLARQKLANR